MSTRASGPSHHLRDRGGLDDGPRLRRSGLLDVLLRRHHYRIILAVAAVATPDGEDDDEERRKGNTHTGDGDTIRPGHVANDYNPPVPPQEAFRPQEALIAEVA